MLRQIGQIVRFEYRCFVALPPCRPIDPKEAREKVIERTEAGEHLTHEQVKEIVASAAARREEAEAEPASNAEIGAKQANTGRRRRRKRFGRDARWLSPRVRNIGHSTADDIVRDLMHLAIHSERHIDAEAVVELLDDRTVAHLEGCLEMVRRALDFALQIKTALDRRAADGNGSGFKLIESAHTQPNGDDK